MDIFTLNVGQGQFVVVTGQTEAFIVDSFVPLDPKFRIENVKSALAAILKGKNLVGLMITGFDADHFNKVGLGIVLNKYRPDWIMYPRYFKRTANADACFSVIETFEGMKNVERISVSLAQNGLRFYNNLSSDFSFEVFSPHSADMNSSNNCSLVCSISEKLTGAKYLVTGDTEYDRWESIVHYFGRSISAHVLAAPHHGSKNGISLNAIRLINPHTAIVSAGVDNQYGHPDPETVRLFETYTQEWYSTSSGGGQSLRTVLSLPRIITYRF